MSAQPLDLSILIVSWNTRDVLANCLESVYATVRDLAYEVIVVDNASSDGSAAMVRERFPQARLIENQANVGFARANNQALAASQGEFVLLLNSDTIVQPQAFERMLAFAKRHPRVGIVGAYVVNPDGSPQASFGKFPTFFTETITAWGLDSLSRANHIDVTEFIATDWVLGAAMMMRRQAIDQVGVLDENYFMYSEEIDLAYRIKQAGWQTYVVREARIIHLGGQSTQRMAAPMKAELFRSKTRYFRKHHGAFAATWLKVMFISSSVCKYWAYRLTGKTSRSELWADMLTNFVGNSSPNVGTIHSLRDQTGI